MGDEQEKEMKKKAAVQRRSSSTALYRGPPVGRSSAKAMMPPCWGQPSYLLEVIRGYECTVVVAPRELDRLISGYRITI